MRKVFILGMDGADWYFIKKGLSKGYLPNFEEIINNGASGTLESLPPLTAPAWSTISTGKEICNHGIAGFSWRDYKYNVRMINAKDKKAKDMWEYIDGKSIVINVPVTYPVKKINGVIIGGMLSPTLNNKSVYPSTGISVLKDYGYIIEPRPDSKSIKESLDIRIEVVKHYFKQDWTLFFVVFREFDIMQHNFWDKSMSLYKKIDLFIGWLLDHMNSKTNLFIVSDHGFNKINKVFVVENWLKDAGYLELDNNDATLDSTFGSLYPILISLKRFAEKCGISELPLIKNIINYFHNKEEKEIHKKSINYDKTSVIYGLWGELFINSKDKFYRGFIDPKNLPEIRKKLKEEMLGITDKNGIQVINYVKTKDDLKARHLKKVPDTIFFVNSKEGYTAMPSVRFTDKIIIPAKKLRKEGEHTKDAIFIAYGPDIRKGCKINVGRKLADFAPTVLSTLGYKVGNRFDGCVIYEAISRRGP